MKSKMYLLLQLALVVSLAGAMGRQATGQNLSYYVINLGTPLGGTFAISAGISPYGFLGGYANLPGDTTQHAVLWFPNETRDLGTFGGQNSALLNQLSGFSETADPDPLGQDFCATTTRLVCLPFTARSGHVVALPLLGGYNGAAFGNNDRGQVAGTAQTTFHDPSCLVDGQPVPPISQVLQTVPTIWRNGRVHQLPLPTGDTEGSANAINNLGQATGSTGDCVNTPAAHAVLWKDGKTIILGSLGGTLYNNAFAINDLAEVTGTSDIAGDATSHAFLWKKGVMHDLGTLPGDVYSVGNSINDAGQIVGQSCDANNTCRAFLWEKGKMIDLNTRLAVSSGLSLVYAATIDDVGVIAGFASDRTTSTLPAFVAIPDFFSNQESPSTALRLDAVPGASVPAVMRTLMQQNLRTGKGAKQIGPH